MQFYKDKSFLTNLVAVLIIAIGWALHDKYIPQVGYYALSGAITNWLAIYMLFEKVPFLYGSGVIPLRFEQFKAAIKTLIMQQFFTEENIQRFFSKQALSDKLNFVPVIEKLDYEKLYDSLVEAILESKLGSMLAMFGGVEALEPMKDSVIEKLKQALLDIADNDTFKTLLSTTLGHEKFEGIQNKVESIVDARLNEMTPQIVKVIVQNMIREHLGWLVVWGGVFGGLIGLVMSLIS